MLFRSAGSVGVPTGRSSDRSLTYEQRLGARRTPTSGTAARRSNAARQRPGGPWGRDVRRNLPSPRQCGGPRSDHPTPGDGPRPDQPTGYVDLIDGGRRPHGTRLSRRGRSLRRSHPRGVRDLGHLGCCCGTRALGRVVLAGVRRSRGAPRDRPGKTTVFSRGQDRRGRHFGGDADGQDPMESRRGSDVAPIFLPRISGVADAFGQRWRWCGGPGHPIGSRSRESSAPSGCPFAGAAEVSRSGGAPSGEAQESIERCGSATNRPSQRISERNKAS